MVNSIKKLYKRLRFIFLFKRAVRRAVELHGLDGRKYLVINDNYTPRVVAKSQLRKMLAQRCFKKGVKMSDLENSALFITR